MGYPKEIYNRAYDKLLKRKENARLKAAANKQQLYAKLPRLEQIERQLNLTGINLARLVLNGSENLEQAIEKMKNENLSLQKERDDILLSNGYSTNCLDINYFCAKCSDTGYIDNNICDCFKQLLKDEAYASLGSVSLLSSCSFDNFNLSYYPTKLGDSSDVNPRAVMQGIYDYCVRYARNFGNGSDSILMMGHTGLGKTHLSVSIAAGVIEKGNAVIYSSVQNLMDRLERERFGKDNAADDSKSYMQLVLESDLLILDDLGTEFATTFTNSCLYNIINTRLIDAKPTIINTNLDIEKMEKMYSQRIVSRLACQYRVLKFAGKDIRLVSGMKNKS